MAAGSTDAAADPTGPVSAVLDALQRTLTEDHAEPGVGELRFANAGLISWVFAGDSTQYGEVAVRVPRRRWVQIWPVQQRSRCPATRALPPQAVDVTPVAQTATTTAT